MSMFLRFPGGKGKAVTLSYDDGVTQDVRLIEIMKKHGLKGTFNLNSGLFAPEGCEFPPNTKVKRMSKKCCLETYRNSGMEIAVHGLSHPYLEQLPPNVCTYEILQDRLNLEHDFHCIVRGMAYPFGTFNEQVVTALQQCGIVYARTVASTEKFDLPTDWLRMPATCHHNNPRLMELARTFVEKSARAPQLFYLWGHSYEFDIHNNWEVMERFAQYMGCRDDIWYATNIEIYDYVRAFSQLQFSADGQFVHNPTNTTLFFAAWLSGELFHTYCIAPGDTIVCADN